MIVNGNHTVSIITNNIIYENADAIVCPCNKDLKDADGIGREIERAAGPDMVDELAEFYQKNGEIKMGGVVRTTGNNL